MTSMLEKAKDSGVRILRWSERYTKTDMVYLIKNTSWLNLNFIFSSVFAFLLSIAFANLLTKTEYGTYQYILSISSLLVAFTFTGFNTAIAQSVARGYEGTFRASIRPQLVWNLLPAVAALLWGGYYLALGNLVLAFGLFCVGFSLPLINTFNSYTAFLVGKQNFRLQSFYAITSNAAYYVCIFLCVLFLPQALLLVFINLAITSATAIFFYFRTVRKFRTEGGNDPEAFSYARHLSVMNVLNTIAGQMDNLLVFHFLGAAELAIYGIATLLPEKVGGLLKPITSAAFPRFASRDIGSVRDNFGRRLLWFFALIIACVGLYILIAPPLFSFIYPAYSMAVPYSQLYAFTLVSFIGGITTAVLSAHRKVKELYLFNIVVPIIQITLQTVAIIQWGLWGIVGAKIASSVLASIIAVILFYAVKTNSNGQTINK